MTNCALDVVGTTIGGESRQGFDPKQVENAFVAPQRTTQEIGYIVGPKPGVSRQFASSPPKRNAFRANSHLSPTLLSILSTYTPVLVLDLHFWASMLAQRYVNRDDLDPQEKEPPFYNRQLT